MFDGFLIVLPIIICLAAGYTFKRVGLLDDNGLVQIGNVVFYVASPCLFFRMTNTIRPENLTNVRFIIVFHAAMIAALVLAGIIGKFRKGDRKRRALSTLIVLRTNCVFMGLPTAMMIWGDSMMKPFGLFLALTLAGSEIFAALGGLIVLYGGFRMNSLKYVLKAFIKNPIVISSVLGVAWGLAVGKELPRCIDLPIKIFADLGTGLALISIGMKVVPEKILSDMLSTWPDSLIRLIAVPLLIWAVFQMFPCDPDLQKVAILIFAMPAATNSFPMALAMGMDADYAARVVMASHLLSVFTLPVIARIFLI